MLGVLNGQESCYSKLAHKRGCSKKYANHLRHDIDKWRQKFDRIRSQMDANNVNSFNVVVKSSISIACKRVGFDDNMQKLIGCMMEVLILSFSMQLSLLDEIKGKQNQLVDGLNLVTYNDELCNVVCGQKN